MTIFSIQSILNSQLNIKREKKEINSWYVSGLGSCITGRYLERLGKKPDIDFDARTLRVFSCGKIFENWLIDLIKEERELKFETQGRVESKEYNLTGYWDLKVIVNNKPIIYEIKSKHSKAFWYMDKKKEGANLQHQMQLWSYLWLSGIDEGRIIYLSKDDLSILEYPIYRNDEKLKELVLNELELLNHAWKEKNPIILPLPDKKSWQAKYCRFHKQCIKIASYLQIHK